MSTGRKLIAALVVGAILGAGALVLQRWVASTRFAAIGLVLTWFVVVAIGAAVYLRGRPELRLPLLGTIAAALVASVAIGWWTGFRDREVDEEVVVASGRAAAGERAAGLAAQDGGEADAPGRKPEKDEPPAKPVSLAAGSFAGQDGHAGTGRVEVIRAPDGTRSLVFTRFDVDPGVDVGVYLAPDASGIEGGLELGGLKGNVGDQQYEIPADADLGSYGSVVLWCKPFTVRIATAELS